MGKTKKIHDNSFIGLGLTAYGLTPAELSRLTKISPDKLSKSMNNRRGVSAGEYIKIMEVFRQKSATLGQDDKPLLKDRPQTTTQAEGNGQSPSNDQEGDTMRDSGLWDVIGDLTRRIARLEREKEQAIEEAQKGPRRRSKR